MDLPATRCQLPSLIPVACLISAQKKKTKAGGTKVTSQMWSAITEELKVAPSVYRPPHPSSEFSITPSQSDPPVLERAHLVPTFNVHSIHPALSGHPPT
jgi:hypothetical protein